METPRTPEKEIISVQYYNVIFYMIFRRGIDTLKQSALSKWIKKWKQYQNERYLWLVYSPEYPSRNEI